MIARFKKQAENCLRGQPAFCEDKCPFEFDVRDFISKMRRGGFDAAFRAFRGAAVFPGIVARHCPRYCEKACVRCDLDRAVDLSALESASMAYARRREPADFNLPARQERVAVVGAGISGLACALRLTNRKYAVTVFEASERIGGHLWELDPSGSFLSDIEEQFKKEKYELVLNCEIKDLGSLDFDAYYVAAGAGAEIDVSAKGAVLSGGAYIGSDNMRAIADGAGAASRIDRYFRSGTVPDREENTGTKLVVDISGAAPDTGAEPSGGSGYTREEAASEAGRCLMCDCDFCQRHSDVMGFYKKFPKELADEVAGTVNAASIFSTRMSTRLLAVENVFALGKEICPAGIDFESFLHEGHAVMQRQRNMPEAFTEYWLNDMKHASETAALDIYPSGKDDVKYIYFPGCQMGAWNPEYVVGSYELLLKIEPSAALMLGCCGAPALWAAKEDELNETVRKLADAWENHGKPAFIFACPTCQKVFEKYAAEIEGTDIYSFLLEKGFEPELGDRGTASVFDPCSSRDNAAMRDSVRKLAAKAGFSLEPLAYEGERAACCGFGGQSAVANPEYFETVARNRAELSENPYITYCVNCENTFLSRDKKCGHILPLICGISPEKRLSAATLTERRRNREWLKRVLMNKYGEGAAEERERERFTLEISEELKRKLSGSWIIEDDAISAVKYCEESGRKIRGAADGHFHGHLVIGHMTYWVEYEILDDNKFRLNNAYAHRMKIKGDGV